MQVLSKPMNAPNLRDDQFLRAVCGLRPCRHGGLRIEQEQIAGKAVVHHYGHGGCGVTIAFGTAKVCCDLTQSICTPGESVAVLGGGVVGLITARELAERGFRVEIYADKVGHDTTSILAGALWLPVGIEFGDSESQLTQKQQILEHSLKSLRSLSAQRYGIEQLDVYEPIRTQTEPGLFKRGLIEEPVLIDSFPFPSQAEPLRSFRTLFIHTPRFLSALLDDLRAHGIPVHRRRFESARDLAELPQRTLVNCLALGSRDLFDDKQVYPARGVLVHMKPQPLGYCVHDGYKYMFPREDALVLGGCFQPDQWDDVPDEALIHEIISHHRGFFGQACMERDGPKEPA